MPPPKVIHFIWAGGEKPFPHNNILQKWLDKNSDMQIILWVDSETTKQEVFSYYEKELKYVKNFTIESIENLIKSCQESKNDKLNQNLNEIKIEKQENNNEEKKVKGKDIVFSDITNLKKRKFIEIVINENKDKNDNEDKNKKKRLSLNFFNKTENNIPKIDQKLINNVYKLIRYEINRFHPNYGRSSDMLRYLILYKYGGLYFDSDIKAGAEEISKKCDFAKENQFQVITNSQPRPNNLISDNPPEKIGNDGFLCSPGNEVMKQFLEQLVVNYNKNLKDVVDKYETKDYKTTATISITGPNFVQSVLQTIGLTNNNNKENKEQLPVLINNENKLPLKIYQPLENNHNDWLREYIRPSKTIEDALNIAEKSMNFEAEYMKIIRFSDHVRDISLSIQQSLNTPLSHVVEQNLQNKVNNESNLKQQITEEIEKLKELSKKYEEQQKLKDDLQKNMKQLLLENNNSQHDKEILKLNNLKEEIHVHLKGIKLTREEKSKELLDIINKLVVKEGPLNNNDAQLLQKKIGEFKSDFLSLDKLLRFISNIIVEEYISPDILKTELLEIKNIETEKTIESNLLQLSVALGKMEFKNFDNELKLDNKNKIENNLNLKNLFDTNQDSNKKKENILKSDSKEKEDIIIEIKPHINKNIFSILKARNKHLKPSEENEKAPSDLENNIAQQLNTKVNGILINLDLKPAAEDSKYQNTYKLNVNNLKK